MHIPDGFLSNRIAIGLDVVSAATILCTARRARIDASGRMVPIMGVLAAFVFAAQLLNFPVFGGTSGHLVGGALLAILLGPMGALLTMATVVMGQALFLQDGGLIALGANIFNIGAVTVFSGYAVFGAFGSPRTSGKRLVIASFLAGWISLLASSACASFELALSGTIALSVGLPTMTGYHAIIGIAEGGLTAGILSFLARVRPDLVFERTRHRFGALDWTGALVLVGIPFSVFALAGSSKLPDPIQSLLASTAGSASEVSVASTASYTPYLWRALFLFGFIGIAYSVMRFAGRRGKRP